MRIKCPDCPELCRGEDVAAVRKAYLAHAKKKHGLTFKDEKPRTPEQIVAKKPGKKRTHKKA